MSGSGLAMTVGEADGGAETASVAVVGFGLTRAFVGVEEDPSVDTVAETIAVADADAIAGSTVTVGLGTGVVFESEVEVVMTG